MLKSGLFVWGKFYRKVAIAQSGKKILGPINCCYQGVVVFGPRAKPAHGLPVALDAAA